MEELTPMLKPTSWDYYSLIFYTMCCAPVFLWSSMEGRLQSKAPSSRTRMFSPFLFSAMSKEEAASRTS